MSRLLGIVLCLSLVILIGATLIGRAIDTEVQQRVIFTKNGQTLDCNRTEGVDGRVFYTHCVSVP